MADTITLEIESNGQITSHELPVEERDGRKVVRLVVDVQPAGGSGRVYADGGGGARGGRGYAAAMAWPGQGDMIAGGGGGTNR